MSYTQADAALAQAAWTLMQRIRQVGGRVQSAIETRTYELQDAIEALADETKVSVRSSESPTQLLDDVEPLCEAAVQMGIPRAAVAAARRGEFVRFADMGMVRRDEQFVFLDREVVAMAGRFGVDVDHAEAFDIVRRDGDDRIQHALAVTLDQYDDAVEQLEEAGYTNAVQALIQFGADATDAEIASAGVER